MSGFGDLEGRSRRLWRVAAVVLTLVVALLIASRIGTDLLWFRSLGFQAVYNTRLAAGALLFAVFAVVMAAAITATMLIAHRLRPKVRQPGPSEMLNRYRDALDRRVGRAVAIPAAVMGLFAGVSAMSQVETFLGWRNATSFGVKDPWFGKDVSFFVFDLPWWRYVVGFATMTLIVSAVAAAFVHFSLGALRASAPLVITPGGLGQLRRYRPRGGMSMAAQTHLSVLIGLILLVHAVGQLLDRYQYSVLTADNVVTSGSFTGVSYTDLNARIPAKTVMAAISVVVALAFFLSPKLRGWRVPGLGLVLMLVSSLIITGIYPAVLQRFDVKPDEQEKQRPFVAANIAATRAAFGLTGIQTSDYNARTTASPGQLRADAEALPSLRLMDPSVIGATFDQLQQVRGYYSFPPVLDVDRYTLNGTVTDVVVSAREIELAGLPDKSWNNVHTVYTHGYGVVAAYGNQRQANGTPVWLAGGLPPTGPLNEAEPRIYYGELASQYVVVGAPSGATPIELDLPYGGKAGAEQRSTYTGQGGVRIGNPLVRLMHAIRFGDLNLLLSDRVNSESRILYNRQPLQRVAEVAPWLTVDNDTYPAVVNGRVVWIVDGYTTSANFPNSQSYDLRAAASDAVADTMRLQQSQSVNYLRNSVKATVDAYTGQVTLYAWDEAEPLLHTWMKTYPGVVKPKSAISPELMQHLRYPQDQFKVQRAVLSRYHVTDPLVWMQGVDEWQVPLDPPKTPVTGGATPSVSAQGGNEPTYYLSVKWPGSDRAVFSQTTVMVPKGRQNLGAYVSVDSDATMPGYGTLRVLKMSSDQVPGPTQTFNAINQDQNVAERLRPFLNQGSAQATYGNLLVLPVGGGILYVEPIYTQRQAAASGGYPALTYVVARFGDKIGIGATLQEALDMIFGGDSGASTGEDPGTGTGNGNAQVATLLNQANAAFAAADAALKAGDLATYQKQIAIAQQKVADALVLAKKK